MKCGTDLRARKGRKWGHRIGKCDLQRSHLVAAGSRNAGHFGHGAGQRFAFGVGVAGMNLRGFVADNAAADFLANVEVGKRGCQAVAQGVEAAGVLGALAALGALALRVAVDLAGGHDGGELGGKALAASHPVLTDILGLND